jgi:hypothetical protein
MLEFNVAQKTWAYSLRRAPAIRGASASGAATKSTKDRASGRAESTKLGLTTLRKFAKILSRSPNQTSSEENMKSVVAALLCVSISTVAVAGEKVRNWQTGKVLDSQRNRYFVGTVGNANTAGTAQANGNYGTYQGSTNSSQTALYKVYETFLIEGDTYAYVAQERLRWKWSKPANLTVNGAVKYAVEKQKLFVIDDDGKEHEMEIVKKILRQPAEPAK